MSHTQFRWKIGVKWPLNIKFLIWVGQVSILEKSLIDSVTSGFYKMEILKLWFSYPDTSFIRTISLGTKVSGLTMLDCTNMFLQLSLFLQWSFCPFYICMQILQWYNYYSCRTVALWFYILVSDHNATDPVMQKSCNL
jgi:hypothetical protein